MQTILSDYIFSDVFTKYNRFFKPFMLHQSDFVALFCKGLMPRRFEHTCIVDRVIYEENFEVGEMYFIQDGVYSIAINAFSRP